MHILLNASNLGASGAEVLISDLIPSIVTLAVDDRFTLLLPSSKKNLRWLLPENCSVQYVRRFRVQEISRMWDIYIGLKKICRSLNADVCLTLGDVGPVDPGVPHVIYLHNAYFVYLESYLMKSLTWYERTKLRYLRSHFGRSATHANSVIVQTPIQADRLLRLFSIDRTKIHVIHPALPAHVRDYQNSRPEAFEKILCVNSQVRLLFLSTYATHKNHNILPLVAAELRRRGLNGKIHIFLTLDGDRCPAEKMLLHTLKSDTDFITNLGRLNRMEVVSALNTADALFMPTLIESFGLIYLEALSEGKPILTSDLEFAHYICGDLALYYDPLDPVSIVDTIQRFFAESAHLQSLIEEGAKDAIARVSQSDADSGKAFLKILKQAAGGSTYSAEVNAL